MRIAICDKDCIFRDELRNYIVEYKRNKRVQVDIREFESGEDLLSDKIFFDLIFLGHHLLKTNGMQVARELHSRNIPGKIVFVTECTHFVFDTCEVSFYRCLTKPIKQNDIDSALDAFLAQQKHIAPITVVEEGEHKTISPSEIIYLEGDGKYCIIRTRTDTFRSSKTLSEVLDSLPPNCFLRIHKSYAVNMHYIALIDNKKVTFTNGEKALISRTYLSRFKRIYKSFIENRLIRI